MVLAASGPNHSQFPWHSVATGIAIAAAVLYIFETLGLLKAARERIWPRMRDFKPPPSFFTTSRTLVISGLVLALIAGWVESVWIRIAASVALAVTVLGKEVVEWRAARSLADASPGIEMAVAAEVQSVAEQLPRVASELVLSEPSKFVESVTRVVRKSDRLGKLIQRGEGLRGTFSVDTRLDQRRARYEPLYALSRNLAVSTAMFGNPRLTQWLIDVAEFVETEHLGYKSAIVQGAVAGGNERLLAAVDKNLGVLYAIRDSSSTEPPA